MKARALKPTRLLVADTLPDQAEIIDQLAAGVDLTAVLDRLARQVEQHSQGMRCSILILDEQGLYLRNGASPSLPPEYVQAIEGVRIGPGAGSCGTAAYRRMRVVVDDIATDPLWTEWRELAAKHGLRACWSEPILGRGSEVLGTLAMYYGEPRRPTLAESRLIEDAARLAAITIRRWRDQNELRESRERLSLALSASGLGMWDWDLRNGRLHVDQRYIRIFGGDPATFVPHIASIHALLHPDDLQQSIDVVAEHIRGRTPSYHLRTRFRQPDGSWHWVATYGQVTERDARGHALRLSGTNQDVDAQVRAEEESARLTAHTQLLMESTDEGICGLDRAGLCTFVNRAATRLLGYSSEELVGLDFIAKIVAPAGKGLPPAGASHVLMNAVRQGARLAARDQAFWRADGTPITVSCSVSPTLRDGHRAGAVLVFSDVTETRELSRRLERQAVQDPLTGLANRRGFEERLRVLLEDARLSGRQHAFCYLDLDQFKLINDTCGHASGDRLLQQVQAVLSPELRERDLLARLGGDEFGVLLVDRPLAQTVNVAEGLRDRIQNFSFACGGRKFRLGASIGVVPVTAESPDVTGVLVAADAACYVAKEGGRNRVHVSLPDDEQILRHRGQIQWVSRIREALDDNRFQLVFEPMRDLRSPPAGVQHFEILTRMLDADGGQIMPASFIPAAERYQLIAAVDLWILRASLQFLSRLPPAAIRPERARFAINLSGGSLGSPGLLEEIRQAIQASGVPPWSLAFEVTETAAIGNLETSIRWMRSLRDLGCRFALDDFGSGLSSYAYLKDLPVDYLKIDGCFIRRLDQDPLNRAIVSSINGIGHYMGLRTIAEHVENEAVLAAVRAAGIDYAQGYGIARARPIAELAQLLG